jgi:predicted MFS family arabinose efflux permease
MALGACIIVMNLYYVQPLLHQLRGDFHVSTATAAALMTCTQTGYALGLAFVVPLGDIIPRRKLVVGIFLLAALMIGVGSIITSFSLFVVLAVLIGLTSVGGQVIIPFAADLAREEQRGRVIGKVMTGLLMGVLLSRTFAGLIAEAWGWRAVYVSAAVLLIGMAAVMHFVLPQEPVRSHVRYRTLVMSSWLLITKHRQLQKRAYLGSLLFAANSTLWTPLSFHLSGAPFKYSNAVIGLFGLFGVAGILAANTAGAQADKQRTKVMTVIGASILMVSFAILGIGQHMLVGLALGIIVMDAGMQTVQITNQSVIYSLMPEARSRINSAYMVCCFSGASIGSYISGVVYSQYGWTGDCWLGGLFGAAIVIPALFWRVPATKSVSTS